MDSLPPFAIGPHYILSRDCASFVGDNADRLRGVGTLEDVSVALWLLALQVHPQHVDHFRNGRLYVTVGGGVGGGPFRPRTTIDLCANHDHSTITSTPSTPLPAHTQPFSMHSNPLTPHTRLLVPGTSAMRTSCRLPTSPPRR